MAFQIGEACVGCTACARLCPVMAIKGERGKRHEVNTRRCVECGVCGRACPKGAISDGKGQPVASVPRAQWRKPKIDETLCTACQICVHTCTAGALAIRPPKFQGDIRVAAFLAEPKKCVGCALCAKKCPMDAITMENGGESA